MPRITNTVLTNALRELEKDGLVQRIQYNEMPLRVEYSFTDKGRDLMPVFYEMMNWVLNTQILYNCIPTYIPPAVAELFLDTLMHRVRYQL